MKNGDVYRGINFEIEQTDAGYVGLVDLQKYSKSISRDSLAELKCALRENVDEFFNQHPDISPNNRAEPSTVVYWLFACIGILWMLWLWGSYPGDLVTDGFNLVNSSENSSTGNVKSSWLNDFGSFFNNMAAPIISLLSYFGLLYTLVQQNKSHRVSLDELELTRRELQSSAEAQRDQAGTLEEQLKEAKRTAKQERFDSTFSSLLTEHNQMLSQLSGNKNVKLYDTEHRGLEKESLNDIRNVILDDSSLSRYFRNLYQLLKYIAKNHVDNTEKIFTDEYLKGVPSEEEKYYSSLVRSMLPMNILRLLAVNCHDGVVDDHSFHKYFLLIERYSFLEHLNVNKPLTFNKQGWNTNSSRDYIPNAYEMILKAYSHKSFDQNESLKQKEKNLSQLLKKGAKVAISDQSILNRSYYDGSVYHKVKESNAS
ncbi:MULTISPECIES: putative phage abortive infection protein [Vibrio]|uniref:putative phage abortive infection protein n=1 Tax=Vibrio TaxID=662 RepID=UPI0012F851F9|nr:MULTISPECIES: putative phage abortive infection protein [Vibrio]MDE3897235.1 hypothetical protein [Vibrio sp. CC007]